MINTQPSITLRNNPESFRIGLVVPCFNEERRFSIEYWQRVVKIPALEVIFVNDGSTDNTQLIIDFICQEKNNVYKYNLDENLGKAEAIRVGILELLNRRKFSYLGYLDADGAFAIEDLESIMNHAKKTLHKERHYWSSRVMLAGTEIERNWFRFYISRIIHTLVSFGLQNAPYDSQSGFKLFSTNSDLKKLFLKKFETRWLFDLEIFLRLQRLNTHLKVTELPLSRWNEIRGGTLGIRQLPRILFEIITIWKLRIQILIMNSKNGGRSD